MQYDAWKLKSPYEKGWRRPATHDVKCDLCGSVGKWAYVGPIEIDDEDRSVFQCLGEIRIDGADWVCDHEIKLRSPR